MCVELLLPFMSFIIPSSFLFIFRRNDPKTSVLQSLLLLVKLPSKQKTTTHYITHNAAVSVSRRVTARLITLLILSSRREASHHWDIENEIFSTLVLAHWWDSAYTRTCLVSWLATNSTPDWLEGTKKSGQCNSVLFGRLDELFVNSAAIAIPIQII